MLGSSPLEAILGAGIDNRDHEAVRSTIRALADQGLKILFTIPDTKIPVDLRLAAARNKDDAAAQAEAKAAGRRDWSKVKSPSGLALATDNKTILDRYLKRYIQLYSVWRNVETQAYQEWSKPAQDKGEIEIAEPVPVNLAVEVGGSRLVVVDCDTAAQMRAWFEVCQIPPGQEIPPTVVSPGQMGPNGVAHDKSTWAHSDGGHFYFTVPHDTVLPTTTGSLTWGSQDGFAVLWDRRYVLIPPSTRPEGSYEFVGKIYPLPEWLEEAITSSASARITRADRLESDKPKSEKMATAIDEWAQQVSWEDILEPAGWVQCARPDNCGCTVWTAPGNHASPKSATAHDTGCTAGRYTAVNAPMHIWTDHDIEPFTKWVFGDPDNYDVHPPHGPTLSKLQAVAVTNFDGGVGSAMDFLGLIPSLAVDGPDINTSASNFSADLPDIGKADTTFTVPSPADLPANFLDDDDSDSPYTNEDIDAEPDQNVLESPISGVPRIAPFSYWREMPPPEYIIEGILEHGGLTSIIGAPGVGKSTVALDMACHIATGKRWQGRRTLKTKVAYLPGEGLAGAVQRIRAWESFHGVDLSDSLLLADSIIQVAANTEAWVELAAYLARQGVGLIIFDTYARMNRGMDENSAKDTSNGVGRFDSIRAMTHIGVCVVHHTAKGNPDVARGSSALNAALESEILVREANWDTSQITDAAGNIPGKPIELDTSKQKNFEQLSHPIPLLMISHDIPVFGEVNKVFSAPVITNPSGTSDPMQGEIVMAPPTPEPLVETAIRIREFLDKLPEQGATKAEFIKFIRPDAYAKTRNDTVKYWNRRILEAVDKGLRYQLFVTATGTVSGSRYLPNWPVSPDNARTQAAAEIIAVAD